jgi:hypothetical protein
MGNGGIRVEGDDITNAQGRRAQSSQNFSSEISMGNVQEQMALTHYVCQEYFASRYLKYEFE